jgi:hypothetical protein
MEGITTTCPLGICKVVSRHPTGVISVIDARMIFIVWVIWITCVASIRPKIGEIGIEI